MKFCFVCNDVSASVKGHTVGGGELQILLLARALALKGHEVVIVDPLSPENFVTEEGIRVLHVPGWYKGWLGIRLFSHRIPALYKLLVKEKADYYYVRMRSYFHLLPYLAAKKTGGKFITAIAHDLDVMSFGMKFKYEYWPKFKPVKFFSHYLPNDLVFNYILKRSDYITIQHHGQQHGLRRVKGKVALFPNIFDFDNLQPVENPSKDYFVHVGSLTVLKGAKNLIKLIHILDKANRIVVVGRPRGKKLIEKYRNIEHLGNVILRGRLCQKETLQLIGNAKALINTSNFEGFPNIFLEAWAQGVPVISLNVNPGNVLNEHGLGLYCAGDFEKMKECVDKNLVADFSREKLISYVKEHHDFKGAAEAFLDILNHTEALSTPNYYENSLLHRFFPRWRKRTQAAGAYEGTEEKTGY